LVDGEVDFEAWYRQVHPRLVSALSLIAGDVDLGRDAVDEACARALERWSRVQKMRSPAGWTYRVALHVLRRRQRRAGRERELLAQTGRGPAFPPQLMEVWLVVAALPLRQRTAVALRHIGDLTENEIARAMGVTRSTVSSTLADAHRTLADVLAEEDVHDA
jgi:DNA-directed RNA polymerase specialized sigma24 family protein